MRVLSQDERGKILALTAEDISLRNWVMIRVLLYTGVRVSELAGLNFEDIYYQSEPKKFLVVRSEIAKGGKSREIPISEKLRSVFRDFYRDRAVAFGTLGIDAALPLFTQHKGTFNRLTSRQIQRIVRLAGTLVGLPNLHPHIFRHTFATSLMKITDIRTVQSVLGHASLTSTQVYTHPSSEDMSLAVNSL